MNNEDVKDNANKIQLAAERNEPYSIEMLDISGNEIKVLGFSGSDIGVVQRKLLNIVLDDPKLNTKEKLVSAISNFKTSD